MLKGFKTFIVALLLAIFGALESFDFTQFLNEEVSGYVVLGVSVIMMVLRAITGTPIFSKEPKE